MDHSKGLAHEGQEDHDAAAQETFEEAGVIGKVQSHPLGAYTYEKRVGTHEEMIRVMVYQLDVSAEQKDWLEKAQRTRRWMTSSAAAKLVEETGLSEILLRFDAAASAIPSA